MAELPNMTMSRLIGKIPADFTRKDLLKVIEDLEIRQINLHYTGFDGKLKELKVPVNSLSYAELILAQGERIDGSSIFKGIIDTSSSDLYIVPVYKTAFLCPFEENTMGLICRFIDKNGDLAPWAPENILAKAHKHLQQKTGLSFNVLAELEFYIIYEQQNHLFKGITQRGYHQSAPFIKQKDILAEMLDIISDLTASVKYAHSEVGFIDSLRSTNLEISGKRCEQYEIEFLPRPIEDMADYVSIAKWVIRNVAHRHGVTATFTPKLEEGMAGTGLHFHMELLKNGKNCMTAANGGLSDEAKKLIAGLCKHAKSMTAFGNSVSSAYLRLVHHQEAPTTICWSEQNRAALVRVPLGWTHEIDMAKLVNPAEQDSYPPSKGERQTIEIRSPDGSAHVNLLLTALTMVAEEGLTDGNALERAQKLYAKKGDPEAYAKFEALPSSCAESADELKKDRKFYEDRGMPTTMIDTVVKDLLAEDDRDINERYSHMTADMRLKATREIMHKDLHKH